MQLGAYLQKENADLEWKMLRQLYPELQNVTPKIERAHVNGQVWYRLIVESADGGWADLCERLKNDRFGCILLLIKCLSNRETYCIITNTAIIRASEYE